MHNNRARKAKKLWTKNDLGELVTCYEAMDENDEAGYVGTQIEDWHAEGVDYKDFAVFYRTMLNPESLRRHSAQQTSRIRLSGVSVSMIGWRSRTSLPTLRVVCNPNDSMSVSTYHHVPSRGIGATTLDRLMNFATRGRDSSL